MCKAVPLSLNVTGVVNRFWSEDARVQRMLNPIRESKPDQEMALRRHESEPLLEPGAETQGRRRRQSVMGDQERQRVRTPQ